MQNIISKNPIAVSHSNTAYDVAAVRDDFPILQQRFHDKPLVYLDNAATTQKPRAVIAAIEQYYQQYNANVHRGAYTLSDNATAIYEQARLKVKDFIHAKSDREIIFLRGATEAINLVANSFGRWRFTAGDEILISTMEHHANIVPWQMLAEQTGAQLKIIPISASGELDLTAYARLLTAKVKLVALTHVSNVLGTINPVQQIIAMAHQQDIPVLVDGAQAVAHMPVDVQQLDCDFYVFSAHKMYGPTGIGILYGKEKWLEAMPPWHGGGNMISQVSFTKTTYRELPYKFEAGTPSVASSVGLGVAIDYLQQLDRQQIEQYEQQLTHYTLQQLYEVSGLQLIGTASHRTGVFSFVLDNVHPHDIATILDHEGIAVRAGHHCAMPLIEHYGLPATTRASLGIYNTAAEIDELIKALSKAQRIFQ